MFAGVIVHACLRLEANTSGKISTMQLKLNETIATELSFTELSYHALTTLTTTTTLTTRAITTKQEANN